MTELTSTQPRIDEDGIAEGVHFEGGFYASTKNTETVEANLSRKRLIARVAELAQGMSDDELEAFVAEGEELTAEKIEDGENDG